MKIDLSQIRIEFPEKPTMVWGHPSKSCFYEYRVLGYFEDNKVGRVNVELCQNKPGKENDDFWFEKQNKVFIPRPVAVFQRTEEDYFGQGVSGKLLTLVNEEVKKRYQLPLASDYTFCSNVYDNWKEKGFAESPAIRVWEKLEEQGLAYRREYHSMPRWIMK